MSRLDDKYEQMLLLIVRSDRLYEVVNKNKPELSFSSSFIESWLSASRCGGISEPAVTISSELDDMFLEFESSAQMRMICDLSLYHRYHLVFL